MKQILGTYCLLLVSLWVLVVGVFPHHHHNYQYCDSPDHLPDFTPDYTFYTLIYLSSLCLEAPSVSFERGDMISYYIEKLHARHFSAVRNFRAPPFTVVA